MLQCGNEVKQLEDTGLGVETLDSKCTSTSLCIHFA